MVSMRMTDRATAEAMTAEAMAAETLAIARPMRPARPARPARRAFVSLLALAFALAVCMSLAGCDDGRGSGSAGEGGADAMAFGEAMLQAGPNLPAMTTVGSDEENAEDLFSYLSDIDYSKVSSFFLSYSSEGLADEVAVIGLKQPSDVAAAVASLESHASGRVSLYRSYGPDQVKRVEGALIFGSGSYAVLVVGDDQDAMKAAFQDAVEG